MVASRAGHEEMPAFYPSEMRSWWQLYRTNDDNKLGHDALLCAAELGLQELADVSASICAGDQGEQPTKAVSDLLKRHSKRDRGHSGLGFGDQLRLLRDCIQRADPSAGLAELLLVQAGGDPAPELRAVASAGLQVVVDAIANLREEDSWFQLRDLQKNLDRVPSIYEAWDALVTYRNRTLGHADYRIIGVKNYYKTVTPMLADCVAELLWAEDVRRIMYRYQLAAFDKPIEGRWRYRVHARIPGGDGLVQPYLVTSEQGADMKEGDRLVLEFKFDAAPETAASPTAWSFRAAFFAPGPPDASRSAGSSESPAVPSAATAAALRDPTPEAPTAVSLGHGLIEVSTASSGAPGTTEPPPAPRRFAIGSAPVTQKLYEDVTGDPLRGSFRGDNRPVQGISWYECIIFCNALSRREGLTEVYALRGTRVLTAADMSANGYRLPTELEWTFACLAGAGSLSEGELSDVAWYHANAGGRTHDVREKRPNRLGLYDMLGNVSEWCFDRFRRGWTPSATHPEGPERGMDRVCKGGSWNDAELHVTPHARHGLHPDQANKYTGFRIARTMSSHAT